MVKKKPSKQIVLSKEMAAHIPMKRDPQAMETEAIERVGSTLSEVEKFLSKWEALRSKPDEMKSAIERLKRFRNELSAWLREAQKAHGGKIDEKSREKRLREFVIICQSYS